MRILITGADRPLGRLAAAHLAGKYEVRRSGISDVGGAEVHDLRDPAQAAEAVEGVEAILHLAPFDLRPGSDPRDERAALDEVSRGTFVLLHEALKAGVRRLVMASRLDLLEAYPGEYRLDEHWKPLPETTAAGLAPFLAELAVREFVRAEELTAVCLRFGALGQPDGTTEADAAAALERALDMDLSGRKHRWWLFHVPSGGRFPLAAAEQPPFSFEPEAAHAAR